MRVVDLVSKPLVTLEASDSLADVAREMEDNSLAAVAVVDVNGALVGIVAERDVVRAAADGVPLDTTRIDEYMTPSPVTAAADAAANEVLQVMLDGGFRHLPLLDDDEELAGVVTMQDVVRALVATRR